MRNIKEPTTFDEQIELLIKRGLIINNKEFAKQFLSCNNYYTFSGYLHDFKQKDGTYIKDLTFEKVYNIYQCDKRFKSIIMQAIESIEHTIKTKIAYYFAHNIGVVEYLDNSHFKDISEHNKFIDKFKAAIRRNKKIPFVRHHINNYDGKFPIWVAIDLFTMGMTWNFYKNSQTFIQKIIAREFNTGVQQLESWIDNVTYLRNLAAHYMRIYNFKIQKTPKRCKHNFKYNGEAYNNNTHYVFDIIYVMKFLILDAEEWNNYILPMFSQIFDEYSEYIDIECYGFPEDWELILRK